jgi:hypothetical protein
VLSTIHQQLADRDVLPQEHLVDAGYMTTDQFHNSRTEHAIDLVGPLAGDRSWQALQDGALGAAQFVIAWEAQRATCRAPVG